MVSEEGFVQLTGPLGVFYVKRSMIVGMSQVVVGATPETSWRKIFTVGGHEAKIYDTADNLTKIGI